MEEKYYAVINCVFNLDVDPNSLIVKLKEKDIRKIFRLMKKLKNNLSVEILDEDFEMITFDIFIDDYAHIKIINNQLFVTNNDVCEILIDESNLVRDVILEPAIKKHYDDMRHVMQLLYPSNRMKRRKKPFEKRKLKFLESTKYD